MIDPMLLLLVTCSLSPTLVASPVSPVYCLPQTEEALERAARLRNESESDWAAKRYAAAVSKLQAADEIYQESPGKYRSDRAVVQRAIVWNQVRGGDSAAAIVTFSGLVKLVQESVELHGEMERAYGAMYEAAVGAEPKTGDELLDQCQAFLREAKFERYAAQTLHDRGSLAGTRKAYGEMKAWYGKAILARRRIDDKRGLAWSYSNLAYYLLNAGELGQALLPLQSAFELVLSGETAPANAVASNLQRVLEWAPGEKPNRKTVQWWWGIAEQAAASDRPENISAERLIRMAHSAELRRGGTRRALRAAERLANFTLSGRPPEVRTDLMLRAIDSAISGGSNEEARDWAAGLECGTGPCATHLEARRLVLMARAWAGLEDATEFYEKVTQATAALSELGDSRMEREALGALAAAGEAFDGHAAQEALAKRAKDAMRRGRPGGAGGRARTLQPSTRISELTADDPVFEISWSSESKLVMRDLLADRQISFDVRWKPNNHSLNGLSLGVFGGYVQVRSMNYGQGTPAGGSPGETTLDEWGDYRPVPATGALVITKNGSIAYRVE